MIKLYISYISDFLIFFLPTLYKHPDPSATRNFSFYNSHEILSNFLTQHRLCELNSRVPLLKTLSLICHRSTSGWIESDNCGSSLQCRWSRFAFLQTPNTIMIATLNILLGFAIHGLSLWDSNNDTFGGWHNAESEGKRWAHVEVSGQTYTCTSVKNIYIFVLLFEFPLFMIPVT